MRAVLSLFFPVFAILFAGGFLPVQAQPLPADARPWQVVRTLIQETGAPAKNVDRDAFRPRLTGEAALTDVEDLRGTWLAYTDVNIDTIIALPYRLRHVPADPKNELPPRTDTIERALVYVTTYVNGLYDNCYFFCERDSIWRIESWRQFPSPEHRKAIIERISGTDTVVTGSFDDRVRLSRLLLNDADLGELFRQIADDTKAIIPQLARSAVWNNLELGRIAFDSVDEYDGLDDDMEPANRLFYRLNLSALERLQEFGIDRITRTSGDMILLEFPAALGFSTGFAYAPEPENLPYPAKDDFFTLKPLVPNWWLFKRKGDEQIDAPKTVGPARIEKEKKSGKASYLVPKEKESP